jgi:hypothetical protein
MHFEEDKCSQCGALLPQDFQSEYGDYITTHAERRLELYQKENPHTPGLCSDRCLRAALGKYVPFAFEWGIPAQGTALYNRLYRKFFEEAWIGDPNLMHPEEEEERCRKIAHGWVETWTWDRQKELAAALRKYSEEYAVEYAKQHPLGL